MDVVLKGSTRDGYQIVYAAFLNPEPSLYNFQIAMRLLTMVIDLWLRDAGTIKGHIILVDLKGLAFGHVGRCSPITMMHFIYYLQDGLPVRLKGLHFINTNPIMDILLSMAKPFMKKELLDVVSFLIVRSPLMSIPEKLSPGKPYSYFLKQEILLKNDKVTVQYCDASEKHGLHC